MNCFDLIPGGKASFNEFRELIHKHGDECVVDHKQVMVLAGQPVFNYYFIESGIAKYFVTSNDGTEKILMILDEGSTFGGPPIMLESPSTLSVLVEPPAVLYKLGKETVCRLLEESHAFRFCFIIRLCIFIRNLSSQVSSLCFDSAAERLYNLLAASTKKEPAEDCWHEMNRRYSQNEMANIIGTSRVTVSKALNELCRQKKIKIVNRVIYIKKSNSTK